MFRGASTLTEYQNCLKRGFCKQHSAEFFQNEDAAEKREMLKKALLFIRVRILDPILFGRPAFCEKIYYLLQNSKSFTFRHADQDLSDQDYDCILTLDSVVVFALCHLCKICCIGALFQSESKTPPENLEIEFLENLLHADHLEGTDITRLNPLLKENFPDCDQDLVKLCFVSTLLIVRSKTLYIPFLTAVKIAKSILSSCGEVASELDAALKKKDFSELVSIHTSVLKKNPYCGEVYLERGLIYALNLNKANAANLDFHTFLIFNPSCLVLSETCSILGETNLHKELIEIATFAHISCSSDVCVLCERMSTLKRSLQSSPLKDMLNFQNLKFETERKLPEKIDNFPDLIEASDSDNQSESDTQDDDDGDEGKVTNVLPDSKIGAQINLVQSEGTCELEMEPPVPDGKNEPRTENGQSENISEHEIDPSVLERKNESKAEDASQLEIDPEIKSGSNSENVVSEDRYQSEMDASVAGGRSEPRTEIVQPEGKNELENAEPEDTHELKMDPSLPESKNETNIEPVLPDIEPAVSEGTSVSKTAPDLIEASDTEESDSEIFEEATIPGEKTSPDEGSLLSENTVKNPELACEKMTPSKIKKSNSSKKRTRTASEGMPSVIDEDGCIDEDVMDQYFTELYEALIAESSVKALSLFCGPLKKVAQDPQVYLFPEEITVCIKYCHGLAYRLSGGYDDLQKSIEIFKGIIENHPSISFPLAYYAVGLSYRKLNSFKEALGYLKSVQSFLDKGIRFNSYMYPYNLSPGPLIEESVPNKLRELVDSLIEECENPPNPDAICRHPECNLQRNIYYSDPGFKGYVIFACSEQCNLQYHMQCWKLMKSEKDLTDKEFLEHPCTTPDCEGVIVKIQFIDKKGNVHKEFIMDLKKEPKTKWAKWDKKAENNKEEKKKKKQKNFKSENQEIANEVEKVLSRKNSDVTDGSASSLESSASAKVGKEKKVPPKNNTVPSKRKDVISLPKSREHSKDRSVPCSSSADVLKNHPIPNADAAVCDTATGGKSLVSRCMQKYVYSYMADFLQLNGPLKINDPLLLNQITGFPDDVNVMITDSGGIGEFLKQDLRFALVGDVYVCVVEDVARAYQMLSSSSVPSDIKSLDTFDIPDYPVYSQGCDDSYGIQSFGLNPDAVEYRPSALNSKKLNDFIGDFNQNVQKAPANSFYNSSNTRMSELDDFSSSKDILSFNSSDSTFQYNGNGAKKRLFDKFQQNMYDKAFPELPSKISKSTADTDNDKNKALALGKELLTLLNEYFSDNIQKNHEIIDSFIKPYTIKKIQDAEICDKDEKSKLKVENEMLKENKISLQKQLMATKQQNQKLTEEFSKLQKKIKDVTLQIETLEKEYSQKEDKLQTGRKFLIDSLTAATETISELQKEIDSLKSQKNSLQKELESVKAALETAKENIKSSAVNQDKKQQSALQALQQENLALKCKVQQADLRLLYLKKTEYVKKIEEKTLEATQRRKELMEGLAMMCGNLNPVFETSMKTLSAQLLTYISDLAAIKSDVTQKIDEQLEEIKKGSSLCELKEIKMSELPPMPSLNNMLPASSPSLNNSTVSSLQMPMNLSTNVAPVIPPVAATVIPPVTAAIIPPYGASLPKVTPVVKGVPSSSTVLDMSRKQSLDKTADPLAAFGLNKDILGTYTTPVASLNSFSSSLTSSTHSLEDIEKPFSIFKAPTSLSNSKLDVPKVPPGIQNPLASAEPAHLSMEALSSKPLSGVNRIPKSAVEPEKKKSATSGKNNYEKLLSKLQEQYPSYTQEELISYVKEFRAQRQGKLSGLPIDTIINQIGNLIKSKKVTDCRNLAKANKVLVNKKLVVDPKSKELEQQQQQPAKKKCAWSVGSDGQRQWTGVDEETCSICLEGYQNIRPYKVQCGHIFHENCIRGWLKTKADCPHCRLHVLLPDDYPPLM